jgi:hypothetical protein
MWKIKDWPMWKILETALKDNLALVKKPKAFAMAWLIRVIALYAIVIAGKLAFQWDGSLPEWDVAYFTSVLLAMFAIGLSCLFYTSADSSSRKNSAAIQSFLTDMRSEQRKDISQLHQQFQERRLPDTFTSAMAADVGKVEIGNIELSEETNFEMLNSLLEDREKQTIILMNEENLSIPYLESPNDMRVSVLHSGGAASGGVASVGGFISSDFF